MASAMPAGAPVERVVFNPEIIKSGSAAGGLLSGESAKARTDTIQLAGPVTVAVTCWHPPEFCEQGPTHLLRQRRHRRYICDINSYTVVFADAGKDPETIILKVCAPCIPR